MYHEYGHSTVNQCVKMYSMNKVQPEMKLPRSVVSEIISVLGVVSGICLGFLTRVTVKKSVMWKTARESIVIYIILVVILYTINH